MHLMTAQLLNDLLNYIWKWQLTSMKKGLPNSQRSAFRFDILWNRISRSYIVYHMFHTGYIQLKQPWQQWMLHLEEVLLGLQHAMFYLVAKFLSHTFQTQYWDRLCQSHAARFSCQPGQHFWQVNFLLSDKWILWRPKYREFYKRISVPLSVH